MRDGNTAKCHRSVSERVSAAALLDGKSEILLRVRMVVGLLIMGETAVSVIDSYIEEAVIHGPRRRRLLRDQLDCASARAVSEARRVDLEVSTAKAAEQAALEALRDAEGRLESVRRRVARAAETVRSRVAKMACIGTANDIAAEVIGVLA